MEYGENIYSLTKATKYYFNKGPQKLTPREGAFLAMLLPNPKKYSISFRKKKLTPYATKTINNILHKLKVIKYISHKEQLKEINKKFRWEI